MDKSLTNYSELVDWIAADHQRRATLLSLSRNGTGKGNASNSEMRSWHQMLNSLEEAGVITNAAGSQASPQPALTEKGKVLAGFLEQHQAVDELNEMFDRMPLQSDSVFIDLGCGAGPALVEARKFSPRLMVGVDINGQALLAARGMLSASRPGSYALVRADITCLPFKTEVFTHACSRLSLPYVKQSGAVAEMGRILKRGGSAFLQLHGFQFYWNLLSRERRKWKGILLNGFCLLNGLVFHLTGSQLHLRLKAGIYQELAQTESGMKRLIAAAGMTVKWIDNGRLFRMFAVKDLQ